MSLANKYQQKTKGFIMNELLIENITKNKCVECNEKLTSWENTYCIICEPDETDEYEYQDYELGGDE